MAALPAATAPVVIPADSPTVAVVHLAYVATVATVDLAGVPPITMAVQIWDGLPCSWYTYPPVGGRRGRRPGLLYTTVLLSARAI